MKTLQCQHMIEDSVESFIARFKPYAAPVTIFSHTEGSPLLECLFVKTIIQVFERTGPYVSRVGKVRMIVNPNTERLLLSDVTQKQVLVVGTSRLQVNGLVLDRDDDVVIVDVGQPLVVGVLGEVAEPVTAGDWVSFESVAPVHGFIVPDAHVRSLAHSEADTI